MARYAIRAPKVFGVSMATMQALAKRLGHDHDLAEALWDTGWYEARILASFVDEPARVTAARMDRSASHRRAQRRGDSCRDALVAISASVHALDR
jgi:3-methyladenine DNA glycosylase AlkD